MFYFLLSHAYSFYFWHYGESQMNFNFALEVCRLCYLPENQYKINLTTHTHTEQQSNYQQENMMKKLQCVFLLYWGGGATLYSDITIQSFIIV